MTTMTSRIVGCHKLTMEERVRKVTQIAQLDESCIQQLLNTGNLTANVADAMIENCIGTFNVPIGIATNMIIDGQEILIPMATEESSVIAAVCNAAKQCRSTGGFTTSMSGSIMIAQLQLTEIRNPEYTRLTLLEHENQIKNICNQTDPTLVKLGGGFQGIEIRNLHGLYEPMTIIHLLIDTKDAMGANAVNSMAEAVAPYVEKITSGKVTLKILSNLANKRLARAKATWTLDDIGGEKVRDNIIKAFDFAQTDPYRATTHNKGIMNGISAVVLATGNDTRAVEAGAHAYAVKNGQYQSLTQWEIDHNGNLTGSIEMPLAVGLVGGATKTHPTAQLSLDIMKITSANKLARIICAVGLAQNFSAIKALATVGIQKGHMSLHANNIAIMAGAIGDEIHTVAQALVQQEKIRLELAEEILKKLRS